MSSKIEYFCTYQEEDWYPKKLFPIHNFQLFRSKTSTIARREFVHDQRLMKGIRICGITEAAKLKPLRISYCDLGHE